MGLVDSRYHLLCNTWTLHRHHVRVFCWIFCFWVFC
ncbi:uncharacterized protein M6B38_125605 [Iris pallida]|uniref:Uncharacterized protein n=1 Tax=Iris pallida TaxID=29817 RepID=A0AAX6DKE0_IRIPA|nr:uncharacterized protein M6B38_240580 [Iris pallida]KAJ6830097.1 uncharacterized protein M6B38_125605 [Iris pallida]